MKDRKLQWGVRQSFGFEPYEIVSESEQMVTYRDGSKNRRCRKLERATTSFFHSVGMLPWRGSEADARKNAGLLNEARDEWKRAELEARQRFAEEAARIVIEGAAK